MDGQSVNSELKYLEKLKNYECTVKLTARVAATHLLELTGGYEGPGYLYYYFVFFLYTDILLSNLITKSAVTIGIAEGQ